MIKRIINEDFIDECNHGAYRDPSDHKGSVDLKSDYVVTASSVPITFKSSSRDQMISQFCHTVTIYHSPVKVQGSNITTDKGSIDFHFLGEPGYVSSTDEEPMPKLLKLREGIAVLSDDGKTFSKKPCLVATNYEGAGTKLYSSTRNRYLTLHGDREDLVNMLATAALTPRYTHKWVNMSSDVADCHIVAHLRNI